MEFFLFQSSCGASIANRDFERSKWLARRHFVRTLNGQFDKERRRYTFYRKNHRTIAIFQKVATSFVFCGSFGRSLASRHYIRARDISRTSKKSIKQQILIDLISQNHGSVQSRFAEIVYFHYMVTTEMLVLLYIEIS